MSARIYNADATLTLGHKRQRTDTIHIADEYVERFWTPIVGPSCVSLLRWAARETPTEVPVADVAPQIGLGYGTSQWCPMWKVINRLHNFGLLDVDNTGAYLVIYSTIKTLDRFRVTKLPSALQAAEERWRQARAA